MKEITIKRWDTGDVIVCGKYESVKDCIEKNYKKSFYRADLRYANLRSANLSYANLRYADLRYVNLRYAGIAKIPNLNRPTLNEYIKENKIKQEGKYIYVFKGVKDDLTSPQSDKKIKYTKGIKKVKYADCDVWNDCSYGISLSPTEEAAKQWGQKIIKIKVDIGDIVCIPIYGHKEKFRVKRCTVL